MIREFCPQATPRARRPSMNRGSGSGCAVNISKEAHAALVRMAARQSLKLGRKVGLQELANFLTIELERKNRP